MPNPHYQRVLQQDQALPAPMRWLSRAMSSWWTIFVLTSFVVGYVALAHIPLGEKYLWQWRAFDTTQHAVLTWWPLLAGAWLLAIVILWSAMRRLPWRIDNLGAFVAVLGLAIILVSQSWAFRSQTVGIAAVPISASTGNTQADALALNYTTRYGDTHDRVLIIMVGGAAPITLPLDAIPRWNDATGDAMPKLKLHDHPKLAPVIGYGTRITTAAYIADGELTENEDGTQTATRNEGLNRSLNALPYPGKALLALEITADLEDGSTKATTAWLPFEPEGTDSLVPAHFFQAEGLGSVGLAFRPASKKLSFALAATTPENLSKIVELTLYAADSDSDGKLLQPGIISLSGLDINSKNFTSLNESGRSESNSIKWLNSDSDSEVALIQITTNTTNTFILAGLITFVLGVLLDRILDWLGARLKPKPASVDASDRQSPSPAPTP